MTDAEKEALRERAKTTVSTLRDRIRAIYGVRTWDAREPADRRREITAHVMAAIVNVACDTEESAVYIGALARESLRVPV